MMLRPPLRSVLDTMEAEDVLAERDVDALRAAAPRFVSGESIPWYLHAVMVGVAWIAAPCIAVAPISMIDDDAAHAVIGLLGCVGLCVVRHLVKHPLAAHFMLAFSVVFQLLAVFGLVEAFDESALAGALCAALFAALFFAYPDPVHRVVMVFGFVAATVTTGLNEEWLFTLELHTLGALLVSALLWGPATPRVLGRAGEWVRPAALGLLVSGLVCAALCGTEFLREEIEREQGHELLPLLAGAPLWVGLLGLAVLRLRQYSVRLSAAGAVFAIAAVAILAAFALDRPLLPAALCALLLAYHARDVVGVGFAGLALLWEAVFLWVAVDVEALPRAFAVFATGCVLLGAWWWGRRLVTGGTARTSP